MPIGSTFLRNAIAPFEDPAVAAVRCLSVTNRSETEGLTSARPLEWPADIDTVIAEAPVNCAAMIRRSVWELIPYDESLPAVEDKFWALAVLKSGYRLVKSDAPYLYLHDLTLLAQIRKMNRERLAYFRMTGRRFESPPARLGRLLENLLYRIPKRALRAAFYETALYACLKSVKLQALRKGKTGSCI
jgi:hypothetical protein